MSRKIKTKVKDLKRGCYGLPEGIILTVSWIDSQKHINKIVRVA
jgi:hypothetical protein